MGGGRMICLFFRKTVLDLNKKQKPFLMFFRILCFFEKKPKKTRFLKYFNVFFKNVDPPPYYVTIIGTKEPTNDIVHVH